MIMQRRIFYKKKCELIFPEQGKSELIIQPPGEQIFEQYLAVGLQKAIISSVCWAYIFHGLKYKKSTVAENNLICR